MSLFRSELTYRERQGLSWQLVWPAIALNVTWTTLVFTFTGKVAPEAELIYALLFILAVAPWLVRRMFRKQYPTFRLKTLIDGKPSEMGFTESFKVAWLLSWRTGVLEIVALFAVSFFARFLSVQLSELVPSSQEAPLLNTIGVSVLENFAILFLMPFVIPGMFSKQYQGFRVTAERLARPK